MNQRRVFDPERIPAERTARGIVTVENTGEATQTFGVQVRVGEDRPLIGFLSQTEAPMIPTTIPAGESRDVVVFVPLPREGGD